MKSKFIVIDGLDGSGKATQVKLLAGYLQKQKIRSKIFDFPQYYQTFFGRLVGRYLKGNFGGLNEVSPYLISLAYAGDRWQAKEKIKKAIQEGKVVLANRYVASNMAFMTAKLKNKKDQEKFMSWILELEFKVYQIPQEDFLIYLSVSPKIGQKLVLKKGNRKYNGSGQKHDIHEKNLAYLKQVEKIYLCLVKRFSHWYKVECLDKKGKLKTKQQIHRQILNLLCRKKVVF